MGAKLKALVLGLILFSMPAFAASVDGEWSGPLDTPNGPVTLTYTFKTDGSTLTGTATGPDGAKVPIKDGTVNGDKIAFSADFDFGGMPITFKYTGVVAGDSIALSTDFLGQSMNFTVKKTAK